MEPSRRSRQKASDVEDDDAGAPVVPKPAALNLTVQWGLVGAALASAGVLSAATAARGQRPELRPALVAAFSSGVLVTAATTLLAIVAFRGGALRWATGLLSPADLLPEEPASAERRRQRKRGRGDIALIGAGSGSVSQMTLEAYAALQAADVVICDRVLPEQVRAVGSLQVVEA